MPAYGNSPLSHSHVYQQVGNWWLFGVFCLAVFVPRLRLGHLFDVSGVFAYLNILFLLFKHAHTHPHPHPHAHVYNMHTDRHCDKLPGGPLIRPSGVQAPLTCRRSNRSP